jgi:hypothetical protein
MDWELSFSNGFIGCPTIATVNSCPESSQAVSQNLPEMLELSPAALDW